RRSEPSSRRGLGAHWTQFLDQAEEGHLWKVGVREFASNEDKAEASIDAFFPKMDEGSRGTPSPSLKFSERSYLPREFTVPGKDGLSTLVWNHPNSARGSSRRPLVWDWRRVKIVGPRRPGKPDYLIPRAYCPIYLLNTLAMLLEGVINAQFGDKPGQTTEQVLLVLANAIHRAMVQAKGSQYLGFRHDSNHRFANIGSDNSEAKVAPLESSGLAQGSSL
ncbi:hypothetical protein N7510_009448, partial [Penicillium lagena]|uniref:uncharacterized protein n=1 Tax=Penicillium lagena TaxID=94218 RepID=UPI0025405D61